MSFLGYAVTSNNKYLSMNDTHYYVDELLFLLRERHKISCQEKQYQQVSVSTKYYRRSNLQFKY